MKTLEQDDSVDRNSRCKSPESEARICHIYMECQRSLRLQRKTRRGPIRNEDRRQREAGCDDGSHL